MASIGKLELSPEDKNELLLRSRSHTPGSRDVLRSRIILLCSEGKSYDSIQDALKISRPVINKWKGRYKQHGIERLKDAARPGKPRKYQEVDKARVIQLACSNPEGGDTSWSQRRIAKQVGMSQTKVQQILKENDLKPPKVAYWCGKSTDPEFEEKMLNVIGLYMNEDQKAMVLSVDGYSGLY